MDSVFLVNLSARPVDLSNLPSDIEVKKLDTILKFKLLNPCNNSVCIVVDTFPSAHLLNKCNDLLLRNPTWHILILTVHPDTDFMIRCLESGIESVLDLETSGSILSARVKALLRRNLQQTTATLLTCGIALDPESQLLVKDTYKVPIRRKEYQILNALASAKGKALTRSQLNSLSAYTWKTVSDDVVDVHISNLRKAIDVLTHEEVIETVYGIGYRLKI
jgi:DNA-binding response OmpR family regulator